MLGEYTGKTVRIADFVIGRYRARWRPRVSKTVVYQARPFMRIGCWLYEAYLFPVLGHEGNTEIGTDSYFVGDQCHGTIARR